jgi:hypothetical protein
MGLSLHNALADVDRLRAQLPSQGGEAVVLYVSAEALADAEQIGMHATRQPNSVQDFPLYTHPADQVAELRAMLARVVEAEFGFGGWPSEAELRALLNGGRS